MYKGRGAKTRNTEESKRRSVDRITVTGQWGARWCPIGNEIKKCRHCINPNKSKTAPPSRRELAASDGTEYPEKKEKKLGVCWGVAALRHKKST